MLRNEPKLSLSLLSLYSFLFRVYAKKGGIEQSRGESKRGSLGLEEAGKAEEEGRRRKAKAKSFFKGKL